MSTRRDVIHEVPESVGDADVRPSSEHSGLAHGDVPGARNVAVYRSHLALRWVLLAFVFIAVVVLATALGAPVPLTALWSQDAAQAEVARRIFLELRPVRLIAGILVGAALATSGAALQSVFRNPLAEPYLLGISAGGALGATIGAALQDHLPSVGVFDISFVLALGGSMVATAAVYVLGQRRVSTLSGGYGGFDRAALLLTGMALSSFLAALMGLVVAFSNRADVAQQAMFWLLGGLTRATREQDVLLAVVLLVGLVALTTSARDLNAMQVSDEEAMGLGVNVGALHRRLLLAAALMSAAAVATAGLIGFVGLLAPHLIRQLFGADARALIPTAAIGGATLLVGCDAIARSAARPVEIPVGIVTALLGVPLFLFLARRS